MWGQELSHGTGAGCEHPQASPPRQMFSRFMLMPQVGLLSFSSLGLAHWWESFLAYFQDCHLGFCYHLCPFFAKTQGGNVSLSRKGPD